jgi:nicotinamide mononucleotide transporter
MTEIEWVAATLGLINVALIVRRSVWNYPVALSMVALYAWIFWDAKLYSDAGLQGFFFIANLLGWIAWHHNQADEGDITLRSLAPTWRMALGAASLFVSLGWGWGMAHNTDASFPYWDGSVLILSITGQLLMIGRYVENWWWWIVVNLMSIGLYLAKGLYPTAILYTLLLAMASGGLMAWNRKLKEQAG